jgi:hypothetical protein
LGHFHEAAMRQAWARRAVHERVASVPGDIVPSWASVPKRYPRREQRAPVYRDRLGSWTPDVRSALSRAMFAAEILQPITTGRTSGSAVRQRSAARTVGI